MLEHWSDKDVENCQKLYEKLVVAKGIEGWWIDINGKQIAIGHDDDWGKLIHPLYTVEELMELIVKDYWKCLNNNKAYEKKEELLQAIFVKPNLKTALLELVLEIVSKERTKDEEWKA